MLEADMEGTNGFRVGVALPVIHQSISRGIHMATLYSHIFSRCGFPEGRIRPGFADYTRSLISALHAHCLAEDALAYPRLREVLSEAPYDRLEGQHHQMVPLMDEIRLKIEPAVGYSASREDLKKLETRLSELADIWRPHIEAEERHFAPEKIDRLMSSDEQALLLAQFAELSQKHSTPDYLVVPFTLFNLAPEDRDIVSKMMPPSVTSHLIPVAWKEKWQSMTPFLLV
jgi:hypothetical protein